MKQRDFSPAVRRSLYAAIAVGTLGGLTAVGMFSLSGLMLSKSAYGVPLYSLMILVASIKLFGVVRAITRYFERLISHEATFTMLKDMRVSVFERLLTDFAVLNSKWQLSELLERTVNDIEKMQNVLLRVIYPPVVTLLTALVVCAIYSFYSVHAVAVISIVMVIILFILPKIFSRWMFKATTKTSLLRHQLLNQFSGYQQGREDLAVFDKQQVYFKRLKQMKSDYEQAVKQEKKLIVIYDFCLNLLSMAAIWGVLVVTPHHVETVMYASIVMVTITLFEMAVPMTNVPFYDQETKQAMIHIAEIEDHGTADSSEPARLLPLTFQNTDFYYQGQQRATLKNISLHIDKGDKIGLIGESGSGKSTLLQLLAGLYDSELLADGYAVKEMNKAAYYDTINVMQQDNHFFYGTVKDNLFSEDTKRINQLLNEFQLPFTADSMLQEFGSNLSGGERKRLHFIRLLLRERKLWLLDEPFNGVDIINQQRMLRYIEQLDNDTAVVMISHDISVLEHFTAVCLIVDGEIKNKGSYQQVAAELALEKHIG